MNRRTAGVLSLAAYIGSIVLANYVVARFGIVPVGFGLAAPAAVYVVGLAFTARDAVQEYLGTVPALLAILAGAALSLAVASPELAVASMAAFAVSELLDFAVYTPLRERRLVAAVIASNVVGSVVDSLVFLSLAFGSLAFLPGQVVGKLWMTAAVLPLVLLLRQRRALAAA